MSIELEDSSVCRVLTSFQEKVSSILKDSIVSLYLTGSLSYGDFNAGSSDIDLAVILKDLPGKEELEDLRKMHFDLENEFKEWAGRIECSYIPLHMLENILPPKTPRPYMGNGVFYFEAAYGNEWIINQYLLYEHGILLQGVDFKDLVERVAIAEVKKACFKDLMEEWIPKIGDREYLRSAHHQSYVVLNICRILYTLVNSEAASKKASAAWAKQEFKQWQGLIEIAEIWNYDNDIDVAGEVVEFIKFAARYAASIKL